MDNSRKLIGFHIEKMKGLNEFESFIHKRRTVNGDFLAHGPVRMFESVFGPRRRDLPTVQVRKGPPEAVRTIFSNMIAIGASKRLEHRRMLGIDRNQGRAVRAFPHKKRPRRNEAFLIGKRECRP